MNQSFIGHRAKILNSEQEGIIQMNSLSLGNMVEKYAVSLNNDVKTERVAKNNISFGEKISGKIYFDRIIRDIQSHEEQTREHASEILCDFIEFEIADFDLKTLKTGIEKIIEQIKVENNINAEHKLVEGLFEFIWHKKISRKDEVELLESLTEIDKYYVWSYLGDELGDEIDNYKSEKLNKYYSKNKAKWDDKNKALYGYKTNV